MLRAVAVLLVLFAVASSADSPARVALSKLRQNDPEDLLKWVKDVIGEASESPDKGAGTPRILVAGDSWADVVAVGGANGFLGKVLTRHGCNVTAPTCIAIPGSTTGTWASEIGLTALKYAVKDYDYIFLTLAGNDALDTMPQCAKNKTKSAKDCADVLLSTALTNMWKIFDAVHEGNPKIRVVGFGYDTMFGGLGCSLLTHDIFPQCFNGHDVPKENGNRCFNEQFLRIQQTWDWGAGNRSFVDSASILGATQVAAGDPKASTDPNDRHVDMDKMGPAKYWPIYEGCFHPGLKGGDDSGAMVVMEEFFRVYWNKHLSCMG